MLNDSDHKILEEIIAVAGDCLKAARCKLCPFRAVCLPEFLNPEPLPKAQRYNKAKDILTYNALLGDEDI
jgi:hypothetical protein